MKYIKYIITLGTLFIITFFITIKYNDENRYNFSATGIDGKVTMSSFNGEYKIVYFGYTLCPDVCPTTFELLSTVLDNMKKDSALSKYIDETKVIFFTLDPKRDTVKNSDEYVKYFYPNSVGLVADDLKSIAKNYGVKYKIVKLDNSQIGYSVAHSSVLYLFDKSGKFVSEITNLTYKNVFDSIKNMYNR